MNLTQQKVNDVIEMLTTFGYFHEGDTLVEHTNGDYYEFGFSQERGNYYFTNKMMVFVSGVLGTTNWGIPYEKMTEVKKCLVFPFIPTGVKITYIDESGKQKKKSCSVLKRDKWIGFLKDRNKSL